MIHTTKFIQTTWQITWHKLSNNTQRLLSHYCFSFLFFSFPFFLFSFVFFFWCRWCFFGSTLTFLRKYLWKSGAVDFAWDTDFAHLLCVVRHSCTYTKTTICLIGSLYFSEFYGNSISLERRPVVTLLKTLI